MLRRAIFLLMLVLLPLRGWSGDAMALQMALHGTAAIETTAAAGHHAPADSGLVSGPAAADGDHADGDCQDHAAAAGNSQDEHCPTCSMCQTCHTLAVFTPEPALDIAVPPSGVAPMPASRFASAERAPGLKPPIS